MEYLSYEKRNDSKGNHFRYCKINFMKNGRQAAVAIGRSKTKLDERRNETYLSLVQQLVVTQVLTEPDISTKLRKLVEEIREKDPKFIERLVKAGLLHKRKSAKTIKELFDAYFEFNRGVLKDRSVRSYRDDQRVFERFVGSDTRVRDVNEGTVDSFINDCKRKICRNPKCDQLTCGHRKWSYQRSTIGLKLKRVRQAFAFAVKNKWLGDNPIDFDSKRFPQKVQEEKQKLQAAILTPENVAHFLSYPETSHENFLWKNVIYFLGGRRINKKKMRWSDVDLNPEDPHITFREKDTTHTGRDRADMPTRTSPIWNEIYDLLKRWRAQNPTEEFVFNDILGLRAKPEFEITNPETCEQLREGRYETQFDTNMRRMIKRAGIQMYPQPHKALRDVRVNELTRKRFREQELDAWLGNTEAVRKTHYSGTAVTKADRQKALGIEKASN